REAFAGGNLHDRRPAGTTAAHVLDTDPDLPHHEGETGQPKELGEIPPGDIMVLREIHRKITAPSRRVRLDAAVGRHDASGRQGGAARRPDLRTKLNAWPRLTAIA